MSIEGGLSVLGDCQFLPPEQHSSQPNSNLKLLVNINMPEKGTPVLGVGVAGQESEHKSHPETVAGEGALAFEVGYHPRKKKKKKIT